MNQKIVFIAICILTITKIHTQFTFDKTKIEAAKQICNSSETEELRTSKIINLFKNDCDKNNIDTSGMRLIHLATLLKLNDVTKKLLFENEKLAYVKSTSGNCPAHYAACAGNIEILQLLFDLGVQVNEQTGEYEAKPILYATRFGEIETIKFLIKKGASIHDADKFGAQPIHYACVFQSSDTIKWLIENGATIRDTDKTGDHPIHYAIKGGQIEKIKFLLEKGASIHDANNSGLQPIHYACVFQSADTVKLFFEYGATINDSDKSGAKPIHYAARYGTIETIKLLIKSGASISDTDGSNERPIHYAAKSGRIETIAFFFEHGAIIDQYLINLVEELPNSDKKQNLKNYLIDLKPFFSLNDDVFKQNIRKRFDNNSINTQKLALEEVLTLLSYRDKNFADRFYKVVHTMYEINKLKSLGLAYNNLKNFYIDIMKYAPSPLKTKEWICDCLPLFTNNIFTSQPGSCEYELKAIIEKKLNYQDKQKILKDSEKNYGLGAKALSLVRSAPKINFVDIGIDFK